MEKTAINLHELDELALSISSRHGQILSHEPGDTTRETAVDIDDGENYQFLLLMHSSMRNWYLYSQGHRQTRNLKGAYPQNFVRTSSGLFVESGFHSDHLDRPITPDQMQAYAPVAGEKRERYYSYNAGPRNLKRAYYLLDAMAIELGE